MEVLAPDAAAKLSKVADVGLTALLPATPTDVNPPADETFTKWFAVMKPVMSTASDQECRWVLLM